jgi:two-component system response regulator AtoC
MTSQKVDELIAQQGDASFVGGINPSVQILESVVGEIAPTNIPVLLVGESGTGKEMFAKRIHLFSGLGEQPMARLSCAAMNPTAFSSELGLNSSGRSEAGKITFGTVFLDEIGELDSECQRILLCALPDGDAGARRGLLKARMISTTSRNLDEEMRGGRFRRELYYRINGVCLRLPPLRERKEDIPLLAEFFLSKHATQMRRARPTLSPRTLEAFLDHSWPGNIRELENVVKKLVALGDEHLAIAELGVAVFAARGTEAVAIHGHSLKAAARAASREAERELILKALARTRWNRKRAALDLQISYKSLLYKLKQIGFDESEVNP